MVLGSTPRISACRLTMMLSQEALGRAYVQFARRLDEAVAPVATHKHSMNMLILTDYVFQILPSMKVAQT